MYNVITTHNGQYFGTAAILPDWISASAACENLARAYQYRAIRWAAEDRKAEPAIERRASGVWEISTDNWSVCYFVQVA